MKKTLIFLSIITISTVFSGCSTPKGDTAASKIAYVRQMSQDTLAELYRQRPDMREKIAAAPGYGVFSNVGGQFFFLGAENGFGLVVNNRTGEETFMKMVGVKGGLGLGLSDFRAVFIFHEGYALNKFVTEGWEFGAKAEAAAKSKDKGGTASTEGSLGSIEVLQLTESGVIAAATVSGTKYWKDEALNYMK